MPDDPAPAYKLKMKQNAYIEMLTRRNIRPTALRVLILRTMAQAGRALSMTDLENELETVDKSTVFRALTLFLSHRLIHSIDDGSGAVKYAVCRNTCSCAVGDLHMHFSCVRCQRTFCLEHSEIPSVALPEGFTLQNVNCVLKGLCPACASKK